MYSLQVGKRPMDTKDTIELTAPRTAPVEPAPTPALTVHKDHPQKRFHGELVYGLEYLQYL